MSLRALGPRNFMKMLSHLFSVPAYLPTRHFGPCATRRMKGVLRCLRLALMCVRALWVAPRQVEPNFFVLFPQDVLKRFAQRSALKIVTVQH